MHGSVPAVGHMLLLLTITSIRLHSRAEHQGCRCLGQRDDARLPKWVCFRVKLVQTFRYHPQGSVPLEQGCRHWGTLKSGFGRAAPGSVC